MTITTSHRPRAALLAFLLAPAAFAQEAAAPGLPSGVAALPAEIQTRVDELLHEAEKYRGLKALESVPAGTVDGPALQEKLLESFREDLPPEVLRSVEAGLEAFGLIPEGMDLAKFLPELLTSQIAGYYDPERHYLALVEREKDAPAGLPERADEATLVHELTHAIQDQHFHLESFASGQPLDDADAARVALVEGDATLVMMDFFAQASLEQTPGMSESLDALLGDPASLMESSAGVPGTAELAAAPAWFQDTLLYSYFDGFRFCLSARRTGGQALLDYAFTTDPPRSSEQILHPEKWHTRRDDPVTVFLPDLSAALPGWTKTSEGQLGELGVRALLRSALHDSDRASRAAAGWGGDRFAVYQKAERRLLAWITEWDTDKDAREAQSALRSLGKTWSVQRSGRRVTVTRGALAKAESKALLTGLAAVRIERPISARPARVPAAGR